jgi:excisionase family DNA binding protein
VRATSVGGTGDISKKERIVVIPARATDALSSVDIPATSTSSIFPWPPTRYDTGRRVCMQQDEERSLFTVAEVARQLGISENTVRSAIKRGSLGVERVSPRLNMVTAQAIAEYRQAHLGKRGGYRGRQTAIVAAPVDERTRDAGAEDGQERRQT